MDDRPTDPSDGASPDGRSPDDALSVSATFELLTDGPRRRLLYWLHRNADDPVSLDALASQLVEWCPSLLDSGVNDSRGLRTALHHVHLPKLDDADVVEYDPQERTVDYRGDPRVTQVIEWKLDEDAPD